MLKKIALAAVLAALAGPAAAYGSVCFYMPPGAGYVGEIGVRVPPTGQRKLAISELKCFPLKAPLGEKIVAQVHALAGRTRDCSPQYLQDESDGSIVYFVYGTTLSPSCRALD